MSEGFVRLSRSYFDHHFWMEKRVFDRAAAWLDLVAQCAFEPRKQMINGELIEIPRGGIAASERFLSDRWMWSRTKVRAFLDVLESEKMIKDHQKNRRFSVFILCNFEKFNPQKDRRKDHRRTTGEPPGNQIEEGKEGKDIAGERARGREIPPWEHIKAYAFTIGVAEWKALDFFNEMQGCGWLDYLMRPIMNWKPVLCRVKAKWEAEGRPTGPPAGKNGTHRHTEADRDRENTGLDEGIKPKILYRGTTKVSD